MQVTSVGIAWLRPDFCKDTNVPEIHCFVKTISDFVRGVNGR